MNTKTNTDNLATEDDYAKADFKADMTMEQAKKICTESIMHESATMRLTVLMLAQSKDELIEKFGDDEELLMTMIENIQGQKPFLETLLEMNDRATARLLSVACSICPE